MQLFGLTIPTDRKALLPTLSIAVLLSCVMLLPEQWRAALIMQRSAISDGEHLWQLLSSNFVHWDGAHLGLNLLGLLVCWSLFIEHQKGWRPWLWLPVIMLSATSAQFFFDPTVEYYAGFSATLYGMFGYCALHDVLHKRWLGALILGGVAGKVIFDLVYLPADSGIAFAAHAGGLAAGLLLAFLCKILTLNHSQSVT